MTETALIQDLTEKLGKETMEGLFTFFQGLQKEKQAKLATKADIEAAIAKVSANVIKSMFLFWIGQIAVTLGFCLLIFKH